jgi:hypothetical protein
VIDFFQTKKVEKRPQNQEIFGVFARFNRIIEAQVVLEKLIL